MKILIMEPFFCDSHAEWARGYAAHGRHDIDILSMPGNFWKWRMHGGAVTLAREYTSRELRPDFLLTSDMLDLSTFLALTRKKTAGIPTAIYFHENQLSYPWSSKDPDRGLGRDRHYGFINFVSALCADHVLFNSAYHRDSFLEALEKFLGDFPDHNEFASVKCIEKKSRVLHLGLDLRRFESFQKESEARRGSAKILWNHRWEYDKNPEEFFQVLLRLQNKGLSFEVIVLGKSFRRKPSIFQEAKKLLGERVVQFGYAENLEQYAHWLFRADILPVTSFQDFFGISVMEAIYCGCFPILPMRLAYPELLPEKYHGLVFYRSGPEFAEMLEKAVVDIENTRKHQLRSVAGRFDWKFMGPVHDELFETLVRGL